MSEIIRSRDCPQCGKRLERVCQSDNSPLNRYQFDAIKAGDYYCRQCPSNERGQVAYCYWWEHELTPVHDYSI